MACPGTRLNLASRITTSSLPFSSEPPSPRGQQSTTLSSHLSVRNFRKSKEPIRAVSKTPALPMQRKTSVPSLHKARNAIYIPASAPGPLVPEFDAPFPGKTTQFSRWDSSSTHPVTDLVSKPTSTIISPTPRPSIRAYASSPSMTLRPQPSSAWPNLPLRAEAVSSAEHPTEQIHTHKSRRHCRYGTGYNSHFISGLQPLQSCSHPCEAPLPLVESHLTEESDSSNTNTPPAVYASESDSDSTSSFDRGHDRGLRCAFPKPPTSVNGSGMQHLRGGDLLYENDFRVESSPLFTEEETDAVKKFLRRRWGTVIERGKEFGGEWIPHVDVGGQPKDGRWEEGETDFSWEAESAMHIAEGILEEENVRPLRTEGLMELRVARGFGCAVSVGVDGREPSLGHAGGTARSHSTSRQHTTVNGTTGNSEPYPYTHPVQLRTNPPVVRKVASMRASENNGSIIAAQVLDLRETLPLRLGSKPPSALDRLDASIAELQAHKPCIQESQAIPSSSGAGVTRKPKRPRPVPFQYDSASLESSGRKHPSHRSQVSLPPIINRRIPEGQQPMTSSSSVPTSGPLATAFQHRTTWSQPPVIPDKGNPLVAARTEELGLKSFIDITPERELRVSASGVHKERVRKLLARASSGVLGWGRSFTRKGSVAR